MVLGRKKRREGRGGGANNFYEYWSLFPQHWAGFVIFTTVDPAITESVGFLIRIEGAIRGPQHGGATALPERVDQRTAGCPRPLGHEAWIQRRVGLYFSVDWASDVVPA